MLRRFLLPALLLSAMLGFGCADALVAENLNPGDLIPEGVPPAVGNATDSFGFAVTAQALAFEQDYTLTFTGDASTVGLSVVGYAGGTASLDVLDAEGAVLYARNLAQNVAEGADAVTGRPARAVLRFEDYTGIVSIGIAAE